MAQWKTSARFKRRRIPKGHPSPTDYYPKKTKLHTSQLEESKLNFFHTPQKNCLLLPPQLASYSFSSSTSFRSLESTIPIISKNHDSHSSQRLSTEQQGFYSITETSSPKLLHWRATLNTITYKTTKQSQKHKKKQETGLLTSLKHKLLPHHLPPMWLRVPTFIHAHPQNMFDTILGHTSCIFQFRIFTYGKNLEAFRIYIYIWFGQLWICIL